MDGGPFAKQQATKTAANVERSKVGIFGALTVTDYTIHANRAVCARL
jgi:hypothetical protein